MQNSNLYTKSYQLLERCTPLKFDCGRLCGQVCCQGAEANAGMWLFPGEEELLAAEPSFKIIPSGRKLANGRKLYHLVCPSRCPRELRPLACRIFPLTPILSKDMVRVVIDPRAKPLCPLAEGRDRLQQEFVRKVGSVLRELAQDPEVREYLAILTKEIEEYQQVYQLFRKE